MHCTRTRWTAAATATLAAAGLAFLISGAGAAPPSAAGPSFAIAKIALGGSPRCVEAGDVDGDGDNDLVVLSASTVAASLTVLRNDGAAGFAPAWTAALTASIANLRPDLELADLDGDGDLDLFVSVPFGFPACSSRLNAGDGTFDVLLPIAVNVHRVDNEVGDLELDGTLDFAFHELDLGIGYVGSRVGNGDGTFQALGLDMRGANSDKNSRAALGDVTGDGLPDLVLASNASLQLVRGIPGATFPSTLASGAFADVALADLDGDGSTDAAATRPTLGTVAVLLGQAGGGLGTAVAYPAGPQPDAIAVADLGVDSIPDVATTHRKRGLVSVLTGGGGGALLPPVSLYVTRFPTDIAAADLDGDGDVDLAVTDDQAGTVSLLWNQVIP